MLKKLSIPFLITLLITLVFSSTALAAEGPPTGRIRVRGEILSVNAGAGSFQLQSAEGERLTFFVSENTRYLGKAQGLGDLQAGWKAGVIGRQVDGRNQAAAVIALEPKDRPRLSKYRGEVTAVDAQAGKFRLETRDGAVLTFFVHEKTRYGGQLENLESMEIGWQAGVAALEDQEGRLNAAVVIAGGRQERPDLERFRGTVTAVDAAAGKFRLETPDGEELTFFVSERTRYRGQVEGLDDLQVGWKAVVGAAEDEEGVLQAVLVAAGDPEDLPDMIRFRGTVTAVDAAAGKFRLETPDGEELTFFVSERTRYRGQVEGLDDLQVGWKAVVGAAEDEDGVLQAVLVAAGDPEDLPDMIRFRGTVTAVDAAAGKFRLETPDGEELTFFVRERTRYKGELNSLAELQTGWQAGVGGFEGEDGQLQALVVIAGEGRPGGRFGDPGEEFAPGSPPFGPEADF